LGNFSTLSQGFINARDAVFFHRQQKTRRHLRLYGTGIEKRRRGMGKPAIAK
jgi:hypothetical protein